MTPAQALIATRAAQSLVPSLPEIENKLKDATTKAKAALQEQTNAEEARDKTTDPQLPPPCNTVGSPAKAQAAEEAAVKAAAALGSACKDCANAIEAADKAKQDLAAPLKALQDQFNDLDLKAKVLEDAADAAERNWPSSWAIMKCASTVVAMWKGWPRTQASAARALAKAAQDSLNDAAAVIADQDKVLAKWKEIQAQCDLAGQAAQKAKDAAAEASVRLNNAVTNGLEAAAKTAMDDAAAAQLAATDAANTAAANKTDLDDAWAKENAFYHAEKDLRNAQDELETQLKKAIPITVNFKAAGALGPPAQIAAPTLYMRPAGGIPAGVAVPAMPVGSLTADIGSPLTLNVPLPADGAVTAKMGNSNIPAANIVKVPAPPPPPPAFVATITIPTAANNHKALNDAATAYANALAVHAAAHLAATAAAGVPPPPPVKVSRQQMATDTAAKADAAAVAAAAARASAQKLKQMTDCAAAAANALPGGGKLANDLVAATQAAVNKGAPGKTAAEVIKAANDGADAAYKAAAEAYEIADGSHSVGRHGADIADGPLKTRIRTGIAPDGKPSPCTASTRFQNHEAYVKTRAAAMKAILASTGIDAVAKTQNGVALPADKTVSERKNVGFADAHGAAVSIDEGFRPRKGADEANEARDAEAKAKATAQTAAALLAAHGTADDNGDITAAQQAAVDADAAARAAEVAAAADDKVTAKAQRTIAKAKAKDAADALKRAEVHVGASVPAVPPAATAPYPDTELETVDNISGTITTVQWNPHMQRIVPAQHIPNGAGSWDQATQTYGTPNDLTAVI